MEKPLKDRDWRGMTYGERELRLHVQQEHESEYLAAQGIASCPDISIFWHLDENEVDMGTRAL